MSAHLTSNKSINKLAKELTIRKNRGDIKDEEEVIVNNVEELAKSLYDLNVFSLKERYQNPGELIEDFEYIRNVGFMTKEQYYMSLKHFTYQSCEGRAKEKDLYKALEKEEQRVAVELANKVAEKSGVEWK